MADHINCTDLTNQISLSTLLKALLMEDTNLNVPIRIVEKTKAQGDDAVVTCDNRTTLEILFKQCIERADDGIPAIRVVIEDFADGAGLTEVPACGQQETLERLLTRNFVYDSNGDICVYLANIT